MPVLALDLNSFFASVEQQLRPELRGRPVGVVPVMSDSTCCIAASYPAKAFGVKTGTRVSDAKKLCPGIALVEARPEQYIDFHHRIKAVVERLAPLQGEAPSIDEFICELPANFKTWDTAPILGRRIKQAIVDEIGECMTCSVGIAENRYLAKTASDMQKPDGLVILRPETLPQALFNMELRDLCGIGANMERRLIDSGIRTVEQLYAASKHELRKVWGGVGGEDMFKRLRGEADFLPPTARRTVGHSHVLSPEMRNDVDALGVIHRMLQKAAMRLRRLGLTAGTMEINIRYVGAPRNGGHWKNHGRFNPTGDTLTLARYLDALWQHRPAANGVPQLLLVGVVLSELVEAGHETLPLFTEERPRTQLLKTVDAVNVKYGKNAVYFGAAHRGRDHAPMRIAFTRIPDLVVE